MFMVLDRRAAFLSSVIAGIGLTACGGGGGGGGTRQHVNHPPVATNDVMRLDGAAIASVNVLANDSDPDGDALTVTITTPASIGTATVNADQSIQIAGLPSDFKGLTTFGYQIADPSGATSTANAAIFVGTDPFRVAFAGDAAGNGSPEVYLTDFAAVPAAVSAATSGSLRLQGFAASLNGGTVVLRRADPASTATSELDVIQTSAPTQQRRINLPSGVLPVLDAGGREQFVVSDDGRWIAAVAGDGAGDGMYLISASDPAQVTLVSPPGTLHASQPHFAQGSAALYFLATSNAANTARILYTVAPSSPGAVAQVSAPVAAGSDDVTAYSVSSDQSRIVLQANRGGDVGIYYVNPAHLQTEVQVSHPLGTDESILESTVGLPSDQGGSALVDHVAYTVRNLSTGFGVFVADIAATPAPHLLAGSGARTIGFRPDGAALLYSRSSEVHEIALDGSSDTLVGAAATGWYDSTGNIVVVKQFLPSGGNPSSYTALAATTRATFGTTQQLGTPVLAADYFSISGISHGIVILGEGATTGTAPTSARLALVNALAPDKLLYLASFSSPIALSSESAQVVD